MSRVDVTKYPDAVKAMYGLERVARERGIERKLLHLIKTRVSQINGCAYCIDMHTKDARAEGETEQRLYGLSAWQETPFYTPRERAALEWAETLTLIASHHVPDELYARTREHFTEAELVGLTLAVIAINGWNRIAIPFRAEVGSYQPGTARGRGGGARVSLIRCTLFDRAGVSPDGRLLAGISRDVHLSAGAEAGTGAPRPRAATASADPLLVPIDEN